MNHDTKAAAAADEKARFCCFFTAIFLLGQFGVFLMRGSWQRCGGRTRDICVVVVPCCVTCVRLCACVGWRTFLDT